MTDKVEDSDAPGEAAGWLARLNRPAVDSAVLADFFAWRRRPGNADAYAEIEQGWRTAGRLGHDPEIGAALEIALAAPRRASPRFVLAGMGLFVAAILVASLVWLTRPLAYETRIGEQSTVRLEDGTQVRLDTNTRLEVAFGKDARRVKLVRGQALFDVTRDAARPFRVDAGLTQIRALGTEFDVRREQDGVSVALFEGKVALETPGGAPATLLAPGQRIEIGRGGRGPILAADRAAITGWTQGRIQFDATPLGEAVAEVNRYAEKPVVLAAPALAGERVTGGFDTGDTQAFVDAVTTLYPLAATRDTDGRIALVAR